MKIEIDLTKEELFYLMVAMTTGKQAALQLHDMNTKSVAPYTKFLRQVRKYLPNEALEQIDAAENACINVLSKPSIERGSMLGGADIIRKQIADRLKSGE